MTVGELERAIDSKKRIKKAKQQERAAFDYTLAELIGRSVSRVFDSNNTYPEIYEAYPKLFDATEIKKQQAIKADEVSAIRFKLFVDSFNKKFKEANKE